MSPIKLEACRNCDTGRDKLADEARRQQQEELRRISSDMMQTSAASQQGTGRTGQDEAAASAQQGLHQPYIGLASNIQASATTCLQCYW